ncbi:MAG: type III pantothenate kinase [Ruminococcaceae bacterium]|nr:type III pantothenate kinase [Oscillospiraceae bacterium]
MLLAVNIQNSGINVGFTEKGKILCSFKLGADCSRSSDEYELLIRTVSALRGKDPSSVDSVIIASVVPSLTSTVRGAIEHITKAPVMLVGPGVKSGFNIKLDDPTELGADLAANAAAAVSLYGVPVIVGDFGTASALMIIDGNKTYIGGCLMPGIEMSFCALKTAELLPGVEVKDSVALYGKNTRDCIRSGVIRSQAAATDGLIAEYKNALSLPEETPFVITGEYAEFILPYLKEKYVYVPLLGFLGLDAIYELNKKKPR